MPKASRAFTTPPPRDGSASRRDLAGAFGALMLLAPLAAGAVKAAEIDGELLTAFAEWHPFEQERLALMRADDSTAEWDERFETMSGPWHEGMSAIMALSARTPEGIRAKATVMRALLENHVGHTGMIHDCATPSEAFAWSLVTDMLGRGAA